MMQLLESTFAFDISCSESWHRSASLSINYSASSIPKPKSATISRHC